MIATRFTDRVRLALATGAPLPLIAGGATNEPPPNARTEPGTVEEATAAAAARLENEYGNQRVDNLDGTPAAPPGAPPAPGQSPVDIFDDAALDNLNFDGLSYRDGMALRNDIRSARDRFKPFNDAFGSMDDGARQLLLDSAPTLGADLATLSATAARLAPEDRQWFAQAMQVLAQDPARGAELLAQGADAVRQSLGQGAPPPAPPQAPPTDPWGNPTPPVDPDQQPMTRAEFQQWQQQRDERAQVERLEGEILTEVRGLGYDPDAAVGTKQYDDYSFLLALAGRPDVQGDLAKADAIVKGRDQAVIDAYVSGKSVDAGRPAVPAIPGGAPVSEERELATFDDARSAMDSRLDAVLGPKPQRR